MFTSEAGRELFAARGVSPDVIEALPHMGYSSICNVLAAIKTSRQLGLGPDDAIVTVATDGAQLYASETAALLAGRYGGVFGPVEAAAAVSRHLDGADVANVEELDTAGRNRIFNLGYFTWVEQQGIDLDTFEARRSQTFWDGLQEYVPIWDRLIDEFNERTRLSADSQRAIDTP